LNRAVALLREEGFDLAELASINLEATKYCQDASFFLEASQLLEGTLQLIPETGKWEKHYALSLAISSLLATMLLCVRDISGSQNISQGILDHAHTVDDKLDTFTTFMTAFVVQSTAEDVATFGMKALKDRCNCSLQGIALPRDI
jgi:hypothetical protein